MYEYIDITHRTGKSQLNTPSMVNKGIIYLIENINSILFKKFWMITIRHIIIINCYFIIWYSVYKSL